MTRNVVTFVVATLLMVPLIIWGAQKTDSFYRSDTTPEFADFQIVRFDISDSVVGSAGAGVGVTGETAASSGDWTNCVDARGYTQISLYCFEYGSGSVDWKWWDCIEPVGSPTPRSNRSGTFTNSTIVGAEAPVTAPSAAEPTPFCVDITSGAGVTIDCTTSGVQKFVPARQPFGWICGEANTVSGNADLSAHVLMTP